MCVSMYALPIAQQSMLNRFTNLERRRRKMEGQVYLLCDIADCSEDAKHVKESVVEVLLLERSAVVAFGKGLEDFGRDEVGAEERA